MKATVEFDMDNPEDSEDFTALLARRRARTGQGAELPAAERQPVNPGPAPEKMPRRGGRRGAMPVRPPSEAERANVLPFHMKQAEELARSKGMMP